MLSSKLVKNALFKIYKGTPHGMCSTLKDQTNEDLHASVKANRDELACPYRSES